MAIPFNLNAATCGTVGYWRSAAPHYGARTWRGAMKRFALQHGKAVAMLADDGALVMERDPRNPERLFTFSLCPDSVRWHRS